MEVPMRGRKTLLRVVLSLEERQRLEYWTRCTTASAGLVRRCRAVLLVAQGFLLVEVARISGMTEKHVRKWVRRFLDEGFEGLKDRSRSGRPRVFSPRCRAACGQDRLRAARHRRPIAVAVGLP
jgi:hypothetical protein